MQGPLFPTNAHHHALSAYVCEGIGGGQAHIMLAHWPSTAEEGYLSGLMQLAAGEKATRDTHGRFQEVCDRIQELSTESPHGGLSTASGSLSI
eukprot:12895197-Prorocentrum_lima.AAC.1